MTCLSRGERSPLVLERLSSCHVVSLKNSSRTFFSADRFPGISDVATCPTKPGISCRSFPGTETTSKTPDPSSWPTFPDRWTEDRQKSGFRRNSDLGRITWALGKTLWASFSLSLARTSLSITSLGSLDRTVRFWAKISLAKISQELASHNLAKISLV